MVQNKSKLMMIYAILAMMLMLPVMLSAGELRFSRYFDDGMVIQREKPVTVTGFADKGSKVTVNLGGQTKKAAADDDGAWQVTFDAMGVNAKGQTLSAKTDNNEVYLKNILIGDVFLFARQTSIDISLGRDKTGQKAAAGHKQNSLYRAISIKTVPAIRPQSDLAEKATAGWTLVDKKSALNMSAAAFYFGRDLVKDIKIPIGVIDLNMGHFFPVGWLSREAQMETAKFYGETDVESNVKRMENLAELRSRGEPVPHKEVVSSEPKEYALYPAAGYNAVISPLKPVSMKGIIVQIGGNYPYMIYAELEDKGTDRNRPELNRAYVETYNIRKIGYRMDPVTTPRIPKVWREAFSDEALPMAMVMPPSSSLNTLAIHGREMRELLRLTAEDNPGLGLILPGYKNIPFSVQPDDDKLLAERSLKWTLGAVYDKENAAATGPLFDKLETNMNKAAIHFKEGTAKGLTAKESALDVFEAAGIDGEYSPAKASIDGEVIRIVSDKINRIAHVRYNWKKLPDEGLVNASGLPAVPFRTEKAEYDWFIQNTESDLPSEYYTPANEWSKNDVTLVNGQLKTHGYPNFSGWLGPVGIKVGPFGPNMGVREIMAGSPAEGRLHAGDVIYSVNGRMLGDEAEHVMSSAITESETEDKNGKLVLGVRRGTGNINVELTLEVMGSYSSTAPYDCPKTAKIIKKLEDYLVKHDGGPDFLSTDTLFLLASGSPEHQGLVRQKVYDIMKNVGDNNWYLGYNSTLVAEYYLATGDKTVLPYLQKLVDRIIANQIKDTKHNKGRIGGWYGKRGDDRSYPAMPHAGLACMLGMTLAKEAGVNVDEEAYQLGLKHFRNKGADVGIIIYGDAYRDSPAPIDPAEMLAGQLSTDNGKISITAVLFDLIDDNKTSHICSFISTYSYNNTFGGHGGNFWNNFWTPVGSNVHGKPAFLHFWKEHRWYRELNRMFDGSLVNTESGRTGGGPGLPLVVPLKRLRILGSPISPFAINAPEILKPALAAHANKDYAKCEKLVNELLDSGTVSKADLPTVNKLARAARDIQMSIDSDMDKMEALINQGRMAEAGEYLARLENIAAEDSDRFAAIVKRLTGPARENDKQLYAKERNAKSAARKTEPKAVEKKRDWKCLVTEIPTDKSKDKLGKVPPEEANIWQIKVVESKSQAPEDWVKPSFDDSMWKETNLPISWRMYHTALLRTKFNVEDKNAFDGLRMRGWFFRQQGIEVYINGELAAKVNNLKKKTGNVEAVLKESALKHIKNGENTLAVTARHNWRWGMLFMHVYNDGFGFRLDGRVKE